MSYQPFKLERYFAKHEFNTRYLMSSSDPESLSTRALLALEPGAEARYLDTWLGYTESAGAPELRALVAGMYSSITPEEVLMFVGAEEGIFWFMHACLSAGDHIVVHTPCYQSHKEIPRTLGAQVSEWRAREAEDWALDPDDLPRMLQPNTRAVLINTPHNPTGYILPRERFDAIAKVCEQRGIVLFGDEVFRESELDPGARLPAACDAGAGAVSLGVLSKSYGLPGLRMGWVATRNRALRQRMAALKDYTTICNSAPSEFLAGVALRHRQILAARTVTLLRHNLGLLDGFMARHAPLLRWVRPAGSPMSFPKLLRGDVDKFCDRAVREAGVLLLPGSVYDDADNHFRLGFGRKNFSEALEVFEDWLDSHSQWMDRS